MRVVDNADMRKQSAEVVRHGRETEMADYCKSNSFVAAEAWRRQAVDAKQD